MQCDVLVFNILDVFYVLHDKTSITMSVYDISNT